MCVFFYLIKKNHKNAEWMKEQMLHEKNTLKSTVMFRKKSSLCTDFVYQAVTHEKKTSDRDIKHRNSK